MQLKMQEAQIHLAARMERMAEAIRQMPGAEASTEDVCPYCQDTGWYYDFEQSQLIRCPACQCEQCGGFGVIRYDVAASDPRFGKTYPCPAKDCRTVAAMKVKRQGALRKYAAIPSGYEECTFDSFDRLPDAMKAGKAIARAIAEAFVAGIEAGGWVAGQGQPRNWLVFHGAHGGGKTGMAVSIVNALTEAGHASTYIRLGDFIEAVQKRYSKARGNEGYGDDFGADSAEEVIDTAKTAPVLVMDEFDVADIRENKQAIVEKVIRYRHGERLPTVITTNLTPEAFEQRWGTTITTVVLADAHWVLMTGPSLRPQAERWYDYE